MTGLWFWFRRCQHIGLLVLKLPGGLELALSIRLIPAARCRPAATAP
jgi:hypothetical protein